MKRRLFFGLELPDAWKDEIAKRCESIRQQGQVVARNWSRKDLYHLTVLFLGAVDPADLERAFLAGERAAGAQAPFRLTTGSFGRFHQSRVFWLGLDEAESDLAELTALHRCVRIAVNAALPSVQIEDRPYRPHITLARELRQFSEPELVAPRPLSHVFTELCLFESTRNGGQLAYPVIRRFPFSGASATHTPEGPAR
ncbi:RNA 2',3'-cyclic phosphodiesterase [Alicyclobacillus acidocaldarius]|uniref:RNA 2',3'-cyclic phosphodiesterase n=1 Tax=Alicyclobacillus acidocaldarius subsp. acidocaldarius (strain ATCC 27009 / DSM 446 / BCRC 14685 / JCM 5260 / KCTC 1825 / NBRC 15652 / NCIMB 11725 / NRRL B-14509 / 104-IA) TaxID=521098 RepID=C8WVE5_ALIAD|nr:RNA 2',3'-cyclic phosphodiesterase [Alicyclobacillus acidocaldarius]ACV58067.1 2'-5' RNA ligase [Alicyclobacillus acidocaldarius subsp. acidocaldarius DSM 446]